MLPGSRAQSATIRQLLLGTTILDAEANALAVLRSEIHVLRRAVAEVEDAHVGARRIGPVGPKRDGHLVHIGNLVR